MDRWAIRAAFLLLGIVIGVVMLETLIAIVGCSWLVVVEQKEPVGSCQQVGAQVREVITELVAAVLALVIAASGRGGPPDERRGPDA